MKRTQVRHILLVLAGFLIATSSPAASKCAEDPAGHLYGWYGKGDESVWLYPSAENAIGLFRPATQRRFLLETEPQTDSDELVFGDKWQLTWSAPECARPRKVKLKELESGNSTTLPAAAAPYGIDDVRFASGDVRLAGLALTPKSPRAAVVVIHGDGTSDRDNGAYLAIADALARRGLAVLLPDKRGSGLSGGDWRKVGFQTLADDALAGLEKLTGITGELPGGLLTVSQGGWVGPIAASEAAGRIDFVVNLVGPAVTLAEQQEHLLDRMIAAQGFDDETAERIHATRLAALAFIDEETDANWDRYLAARTALLESPAAPLAKSFPESRDAWNWAWGRRVSHLDPVPLMTKSGKPFLVIYGRDDTNVAIAPNTARIVNSGADITLLVLPGRGHNLASPSGGVIDALVFETIDEWIAAQLE